MQFVLSKNQANPLKHETCINLESARIVCHPFPVGQCLETPVLTKTSPFNWRRTESSCYHIQHNDWKQSKQEVLVPCLRTNSGGMLVHRSVTPSSKFAGTHLYTWVERGTMGVKCLAQEHNVVPRPGLEPGPFDPESSALTMHFVFTLALNCPFSVSYGTCNSVFHDIYHSSQHRLPKLRM